LSVLTFIDYGLIFSQIRFFLSANDCATYYACKKDVSRIDWRACIKFESVGMRGWQRWKINRWCFNRGTLYCWKCGLEENACGERKRNCQRDIFRSGSIGGRRTKRRMSNAVLGGTTGRSDSKWLSIKVSPPVRTAVGPVAGLTNGSRNLHALRSIRLPILPKSRTRSFVYCSFYHELHGRNKKRRKKKGRKE